MKSLSHIESFTETYYVKANLNANSIDLTIIELNISKLKKFTCQVEIGDQTPKLCVFDSCEELFNLFKKPENYIYQSQEAVFTLKWKVICEGFEKEVFHDLDLQNGELTEVEELKLENLMLKKKISDFQVNYVCKKVVESNLPLIETSKIIERVEEEPEEKINFQEMNNQNSNKVIDQFSEQEKTYETTPEENGQSKDLEKSITESKMKKTKPIKKSTKNKIKNSFFLSRRPKKGKKKNSFKKGEIISSEVTFGSGEAIESSSKQPKSDSDGKVKVSFPNGDYYYGELENNIYHGSGLYYSIINGTFDGEWKFGKANGYGVSRHPSGNIHSGNYIDDKRNGQGIDEYINGERYEGNFLNDNKDGFGKYVYKNGDYYEGMWKNDFYHGAGKECYSDGSFYEGTWFEDEKDGKGIFTNENSQKFEQIWEKGTKISEKTLA